MQTIDEWIYDTYAEAGYWGELEEITDRDTYKNHTCKRCQVVTAPDQHLLHGRCHDCFHDLCEKADSYGESLTEVLRREHFDC